MPPDENRFEDLPIYFPEEEKLAQPLPYHMASLDGSLAVGLLLSRVAATINDPYDEALIEKVMEELNYGTALISSLHPEVYQTATIEDMNHYLAQVVADLMRTFDS